MLFCPVCIELFVAFIPTSMCLQGLTCMKGYMALQTCGACLR